jgi:hypothetical protein
MTNPFLAEQVTAIKRGLATVIHCDPADFDREGIQFVEVPNPGDSGDVACNVSFGPGTVVSVGASYAPAARAAAPADHIEASTSTFLEAIATDARGRGHTVTVLTPSIGYALARPAAAPPTPDGFRMERHDADWMNAQQPSNALPNAVGTPGDHHRQKANRFSLAFYETATGVLAAAAGAVDTGGLLEVGVDVLPGYRGRHLSVAATRALVVEILAEGRAPFYGCAGTNIASQRTAAACGFVPVCSIACVVRA